MAGCRTPDPAREHAVRRLVDVEREPMAADGPIDHVLADDDPGRNLRAAEGPIRGRPDPGGERPSGRARRRYGATGRFWASSTLGRRKSYLGDLHREVGRTLRLRQAWAPYVDSGHSFDCASHWPRSRMRISLLVFITQPPAKPIDLGQALLDRLQTSRGMFDVVLDCRPQAVGGRPDRTRLFGEGQRTELLRLPLMPTNHNIASPSEPGGPLRTECT